MKFLTSLMLVCVFLPILFLAVFTPEPCEHEDMVTMYTFTSYNSTAHSNVRPYCRDCGERFRSQMFKGELVDKSYLSAIVEHSDGDEIVPGEYYTVTATVPLGFYAYISDTVWLNCRVENEEYILFFNVEFKDEFEEMVKLVEDGDEITFRGRFYDKGCGFTDCELIEVISS